MDAIVDPDGASPQLTQPTPELRDWKTWFAAYDDPESSLTMRLAVVQQGIRRALDEAPSGAVTILSLCAGEGRDLIPVLAGHPRRADVRARLIEFDPAIAQVARDSAAAADLAGTVEVVTGDAADPAHFGDYAPADLLLLCGIFGNVSDADIQNTVAHAAHLTARGGTAIWTRHRHEPNVVPAIHDWFAAAGFSDLWESDPELPTTIYVAGNRQEREPTPLPSDKKLFTFIK
jgi:hypothetical protein